jgi:hypothetical protein
MEASMKNRVLVAGIILVGIMTSASFALDQMGAPAGKLGAGKWSLGADYIYSSQNIDFKNATEDGAAPDPEDKSGTIEYVKLQKLYATLGYGLMDKWDVYGRLGGAHLRLHTPSSFLFYEQTMSSSIELAYGVGTKVTFYEYGNWKLGALGQASWTNNLEATYKSGADKEVITFDLMEAQIAVGPTYKFSESVSVYGGPFAHLVGGDVTSKDTDGGSPDGTYEADLRQAATLGGYVGVELTGCNNVSANLEFQHTAFANAVAANVTYKF